MGYAHVAPKYKIFFVNIDEEQSGKGTMKRDAFKKYILLSTIYYGLCNLSNTTV